MVSHHSRSVSPARSQTNHSALPGGAPTLSESDYFLKSAEFRVWLKDEKGKYFDELSGTKARSYFRKFIKAWNKGQLPQSLYAGVDPSKHPATTQTAYKWTFAANKSRVDDGALRAARDEVTTATYGHGRKHDPSGTSGSTSHRGKVFGPTLPTASDLTLSREAQADSDAQELRNKRRRERAEEKERVEDVVGPREVGREGALEKKRVRREGDRAFREGGDGGLEVDEGTLFGGGDSFKERIARRDAARKRFEEKRNVGKEDKDVVMRERASAIREKDRATMDMFQQLAKQRFG